MNVKKIKVCDINSFRRYGGPKWVKTNMASKYTILYILSYNCTDKVSVVNNSTVIEQNLKFIMPTMILSMTPMTGKSRDHPRDD